MAVSVDWAGTKIIFVPRADMPIIQASPPREIRRFDVDAFRLILRDLEDDPDGRPWSKTHDHEGETLISGEIYAHKVLILAPYTV
ncbi:unnamed protein product, partial [marine sediment metagenome]